MAMVDTPSFTAKRVAAINDTPSITSALDIDTS
jgi:hypothetical protein